jgi:hypothetical protein
MAARRDGRLNDLLRERLAVGTAEHPRAPQVSRAPQRIRQPSRQRHVPDPAALGHRHEAPPFSLGDAELTQNVDGGAARSIATNLHADASFISLRRVLATASLR